MNPGPVRSVRYPVRASLPIAFGLACLAAVPALGQVVPVYGVVHRPPGVSYLEARSEHFDLIFQRGAEREAAELAAVLERTLGAVAGVLPVRDAFRMPVIVNAYRDRGNGFVTTVPFRQEIEAASLKSRSLSPRHASWMSTVGPHELVHAVHADYRAGIGLGWLVRPFAPDVARSLNLWVPPGVAEGAAVWLESRLEQGAGRLHHGYFEASFRAAAGRGEAWSLAEALEVPAYTRPSDRYYVGGAHFFEWLERTRGMEAFRRTSSFHQRLPLLGYGLSLWVGTRTPPWKLGREFRADARWTEAARIRSLGPTTPRSTIAGADGVLHRRPRWLPDGSLVFYRTGYDRRRGLYRIGPSDGSDRPIVHQELTDDLYFSVVPGGGRLLFARYVVDTWAPGRSVADLHEVDLSTGKVTRITAGAHLMAPTVAPDGSLWAIRVEGSTTRWVRFQRRSGRIDTVYDEPGARFLSVEGSPREAQAVFVVNRAGRQSAVLARPNADREWRPVGRLDFEGGSVYDASWTPDGRWVVLTADPGSVMNLFAWAPEEGRVVRLTNVPYGAMEPTVSPDGRRLAFVELGEDRQDLVVIPFDPGSASESVEANVTADAGFVAVEPTPTPALSNVRPYRPLRRLAPRMVYPVLYAPTETSSAPDAELGWGGGLALQGSDPLQRWAWWGEGLVRAGRPWGEIGLATSASVLRPVVRLFDRPSLVTVPGGTSPGFGRRVVRERRGLQAAVGVPVVLSANVYSTTASFGMGLQWEQERLFDRSMNALTEFESRLTVAPHAGVAVAMQSNLRDLVPNSGWVTGIVSEIDLVRPSSVARRAVQIGTSVYLPVLSAWNGGVRISAGLLGQNRPDVFSLDTFLPRGQEDVLLSSAWSSRVGLDVTQPIRFVDDGSILLPAVLHAVYVYGFSEQVRDGGFGGTRHTSLGGGVGAQWSLFHGLRIDLRIGMARRVERGDWVTVFR